MLTCKPASDPESSPDAMASRRMLLGSGLALLAGASLLAGCGSAPRKTRTSQRRRSGPAGTVPLRTSTPEVAVINPVQIDATVVAGGALLDALDDDGLEFFFCHGGACLFLALHIAL